MRTNISFYIALFCAVVLSNCQKEEDLLPSNLFSFDSDGIITNKIAEDRSGDLTVCDHIPPQTNFVSIVFFRLNGSTTAPLCLTEQAVTDLLIKAGRNTEQAADFVSRLFYRADASTPVLARELGQMVAQVYDLPADINKAAFSMDAMGRMDYPATLTANLSGQNGPLPGFIDFYTVRQAQSSSTAPAPLLAGFSGLRFRNRCTGEKITFEFPHTLEGMQDMFLSAGFTPKETGIVMRNLLRGNYSIREVWDLFQVRLAPQLPVTKGLLARSDADCWRLHHVGIGLYNAGPTLSSFYFAQGDGALR